MRAEIVTWWVVSARAVCVCVFFFSADGYVVPDVSKVVDSV